MKASQTQSERTSSTFTVHNAESAPEASRPFIEHAQKQFGMVPNLIGLLSESPVAVETDQTLASLFSRTSFTPTERNLVWLTIIYENNCSYCMAAHTGIAKSEKVDEDIIAALRAGEPLQDPRLEALRKFTRSVVVNRGWVGDGELEAFLAAGFTQQNVFEVLVGVAHKVLSNYTNHIAGTPVDPPFEKFAWKKGQA